MSAEIIPFDRDRERTYPRCVHRAWEDYRLAAEQYRALDETGTATSAQLLDASVRAIRLHRVFARLVEAM